MKAVLIAVTIDSKLTIGKSYDVISKARPWWCLYIPSCFMWWLLKEIYQKQIYITEAHREQIINKILKWS
jgi:hypothetical protein